MTILGLPKRFVQSVQYRRRTPNEPRHNDFYIVEFPKSGITWLSAILANMALIESGRQEVASFTAAHMFVPDIEQTRDLGGPIYHRPPVRLIKSHSEFNPYYGFLIYLVRHPLNLMKSYYRFTREGGKHSFESFDAFCRSKQIGVPAWKRHIRSWLTGGVVGQRLHLCRYEDLCSDTHREIALICENFGWNITDTSIREAVARSSMDRMKESEELYRSRNPRYTMTFVGGSGDFQVNDKTVTYIDSTCREELALLGYDALDDSAQQTVR